MSYDDFAGSVADGQPYFLFLFDNGVTKTRFTADADEILADPEASGTSQRWLPSAAAHDAIEQTGNVEKSTVDLTFPLSDAFARSLLKPSSLITNVTIWRGHHTDPDHEHRVIWKGRVTGPKSGGQTITVPVDSIYTTLRQHGCRVRYQRSCRHALYFDGCNLDFDDFKVAATVSAISGLTLTVTEADAKDDGWYSHGIVEFDGIKGWVLKHTGDQLVLMMPIPGLVEEITAKGSASVYIAPGCDLSVGTCHGKFDNLDNFGGFPNMKSENPFSSSIV